MHWGDDVLLLYLAPFFKPHFPICGDPMLGVKANRSALEYSSSKADVLKVEFSAEWLRIWRYERGISFCTQYFYHILRKMRPKISTLILTCTCIHVNHRFWLTERVFFSVTLPTQTHNLQLSADYIQGESVLSFFELLKREISREFFSPATYIHMYSL